MVIVHKTNIFLKVVYCGDVNCDDSEFLANELFNLGHAPLLVYKGGFEDWKSHQGCIEKGGGGRQMLVKRLLLHPLVVWACRLIVTGVLLCAGVKKSGCL